MARILVVDDEHLIRLTLERHLAREGHVAQTVPDGAGARQALKEHGYDLILLDGRLPDTEGVALLREIRAQQPDLPVVMITAYSSIEGAVGAIQAGANDYVAKPFNLDELSLVVKRALETSAMRRSLATDLHQKRGQFGLDNLVGESAEIAAVKGLIRRVAESASTTVLILGESGTGKDLAARALHYESERAPAPFMNITCTALPETLLESELFGYEAGAFTSAVARKKGLFELADGGTVFMDEIGDMSPALQVKLLRVLEEKTFKRIGGSADISVDVRVIAATNRDLTDLVQKKQFREDLFYRLNIVPITMPPLRERGDDIPLLAKHFFHSFRQEFRKLLHGVTPDAMEKLRLYPWPGNVREMRNVMERAVLLSDGEMVTADDVVLGRMAFNTPRESVGEIVTLPPEGCTLAQAEESILRQALRRARWNYSQAGRILGLSRDQVRYKVDKFGMQPEE